MQGANPELRKNVFLISFSFQKIWEWAERNYGFCIAVAYLVLLGFVSIPFTGDQKVYLAVSQDMWVAGKWLQPILFDQPNYLKPPFLYWSTLISWKIFGFGLFGAGFPSVFMAWVSAMSLSGIARILKKIPLGSPGSTSLAALAFASSAGAITYAYVAQMEIYVTAFFSFAWYLGLRFLESRQWRFLVAAFGVAGLSSIVKSPLYAVFWVSGYGAYLFLNREWSVFKNARFYLAWLFGMLVGAAWYAYIWNLDGAKFYYDFVVMENYAKKFTTDRPLSEMWFGLLTFCLPTLLLWVGLKRWDVSRWRFFVAWGLIPSLFFSWFPYRTETYLFILVPLFALGFEFASEPRGWVWKTYSFLLGAVLTLLFGGVLWLLFAAPAASLHPDGALQVGGVGLLILIGVTGVVLLPQAWRLHRSRLFLASLLMVVCVRGVSVFLGALDLQGLRTLARQSDAPFAILDEHTYIWNEAPLLSLALGYPMERLTHLSKVTERVKSGVRVILNEDQAKDYFAQIESDLRGAGLSPSDWETLEWERWGKRRNLSQHQFTRKYLILQKKMAN